MSYIGHSSGWSDPSAEMQSEYSTAMADRVDHTDKWYTHTLNLKCVFENKTHKIRKDIGSKFNPGYESRSDFSW